MVDGFHWTKVTSKQLRFLYEDVTMLPAPEHMTKLAAKIDNRLAEGSAPPEEQVAAATTREKDPSSNSEQK
jgi:transglutaminase-like putative cysteine protease